MRTKQAGTTRNRSDERGIALIIVMFMVLTMSLVGASLMFVSRTETLSSLNYQTVSQTRYTAESGIAAASNYLLNTYVKPTAGGADDLANYDMTKSPVRWNGADVVLSSDPSTPSNYPVAAVQAAFSAASSGTLSAGTGTTAYVASATLLSMRTITDSLTGVTTTLQRWRISGTGSIAGAGSASVQVSAILEQEDMPTWQYAAFSTNNGCDSLVFGGNAHTNSYDSTGYAGGGAAPATQNYGGSVGTNGNLDDYGSSSIAGSLSTPRSGVGACSANNVTALASVANVSGGVTQLSQPVSYSANADPNPLPLTTSIDSFTKNGGCPAGLAAVCVASANGATITPLPNTPVYLDNVSIGSNCNVHLGPGTYIVNSLANKGAIIVDSNGPINIVVAGKSLGSTDPIDMSGGDINNNTYDPTKFMIKYNGSGNVSIGSNADAAALLYAPNATVGLSGNGDFYGAIIAGRVTSLGTSAIHYDRSLSKKATSAGSPVLGQFTWKNY